MRVNYPGLVEERLPSGATRLRVRVAGKPGKRITLNVGTDHPKFGEHYHAARQGVQLPPEAEDEPGHINGSIGWLVDKYLGWLEAQVMAGRYSPKTLKARKGLLPRLRAEYGEYDARTMPTAHVYDIRDGLADTPATADKMIEAIRVMFAWGCERGHIRNNPAIGVAKIDKGKGGARPWTAEDLKAFTAQHKPGSTAHLCLTLLLFTGCRIGDAATLGRKHEIERDGVRGLAWQPAKKGSAPVSIPMLAPLYEATRAAKVQGPVYLLTAKGRPFASPDALGQAFRKWCNAAGLHDLSAHGVRKGLGALLADAGATQHQIMAVLSHTEPQTSAIYTKGAERWTLSLEGMAALNGLEW